MKKIIIGEGIVRPNVLAVIIRSFGFFSFIFGLSLFLFKVINPMHLKIAESLIFFSAIIYILFLISTLKTNSRTNRIKKGLMVNRKN